MFRGRRTPYISKFAVLEYEKVLPLRNLLQSSNCSFREVIDDIGMSLEHADGIAHFFCDFE